MITRSKNSDDNEDDYRDVNLAQFKREDEDVSQTLPETVVGERRNLVLRELLRVNYCRGEGQTFLVNRTDLLYIVVYGIGCERSFATENTTFVHDSNLGSCLIEV